MSQVPSPYVFRGGLDTTTAALVTSPSAVIAGANYEPIAEGYARIQGYERFDGRAAPSDAEFWTIDYKYGSISPAAGSVVTGQTSGATGVVIVIPTPTSGDWANATAAGEIVLTAVTGTFTAGENLLLGSVTVMQTVDAPRIFGAATPLDRQIRIKAAQAHYRGLIAKVPGSGPVRGVAIFNGTIYAWRDNAGATAAKMFKATAAGWVEVSLGRKLPFTTGLHEIFEGQTIVGVTSGATATVARIVRTSGDWGSTAAGYIILSGLVGSFIGEQIKVGATVVANASADVANTLPAGGQYETIEHNFYGRSDKNAMYAVNGVGQAFEFRPGMFCPISTGTTPDAPTHIAEIAEHLLLSFPGGSVQHSGVGEPLIFDVVQGAGEFGFGTEITNFIQSNESAVAVFGQKKIGIFSGRDAASFQLAELTEEAGAFAWTAQRIARTVYMDMRGLRDLAATQAYGNFKTGSISANFDRYLTLRLQANQIPIGSIVSRAKSQYRVYWADGTGLSIFMGNKVPEALPFNLKGISIYCLTAGEIGTEEDLLAGSQDGYVYRLDRGNSFDGVSFDYYLVTPFNHFGDATREDRFHKIVLEMIAPNYTEIGITAMFDYGDGEKPTASGEFFVVYGNGGIFNAVTWNNFVWSSSAEGRAEAPIDGIGRNAAFVIAGTTEIEQDSHVLQAYIVYRSPRKFKR